MPINLPINLLRLYDTNKFFVSEINSLKSIATTKNGGYKEVVELYLGVQKNQYDRMLVPKEARYTTFFMMIYLCFMDNPAMHFKRINDQLFLL